MLFLYPKRYKVVRMMNLSTTVKMLRKQYDLTQEELSLKSGVGLRFVRDL